MKNFHLPLPEPIYDDLRAESERVQLPATTLAREAIDWWLRQQRRRARHEMISAYAAKMAGTDIDLDTALESAGVDYLVNPGRPSGKRAK
jgi:hypothetical protein